MSLNWYMQTQPNTLQIRVEMDKNFRQICGAPQSAPSPEAHTPTPEPEAADPSPAAEGADSMETDAPEPQPAAAEPPAPPRPEDTPEQAIYRKRYNNLKGIITGKTPIELYLEFLYSNNHSDLQILKNIKSAVESRNSVCHGAAIVANALMHSGTTVDTFLRENLDWLSRATNWAKFTATAGLGVIHKGHLTQV